jgi:hypothetical protein
MELKLIADLAGELAKWQLYTLLITHGLLCFLVIVWRRDRFLDLKNVFYKHSDAWIYTVLTCIPAYHYFIDAVHLGAYIRYRPFTKVSYLVHHIFGINMMMFGVQVKLYNYSTLMMQATHGLLMLSFKMPHVVTVVCCNYYYSVGIIMVLYHTFVMLRVKMEWKERITLLGFVISVVVMVLLRNQNDIFDSCYNPPDTSPLTIMLQIYAGVNLALITLIPTIRRTLRSSS